MAIFSTNVWSAGDDYLPCMASIQFLVGFGCVHLVIGIPLDQLVVIMEIMLCNAIPVGVVLHTKSYSHVTINAQLVHKFEVLHY
jgi:hypothetical protein